MNRQGSNQRAEKAWQLHIAGRTWREVAEVTGFKSPQSAQKAAMAWLKKNPPSTSKSRAARTVTASARFAEC